MKAILLALALSLAFATMAADENTFESQMLGFSLTKPESWHFVSANTYLQRTKEATLNDPEMDKRWKESMRAPLVVIAKYPINHPDVNTTVKADAKPYGQLSSTSSGVDIINTLLPVFQKNFHEFQIEKGPFEVTLSGHKGGYIKINYVSVTTAGRYPSTSEMWIVPRENVFFILGGGYKRGAKEAPHEIAQIIQSVSIE